MRLSVVSDLHIQGPEDPIYSRLLHLIGGSSGEGDVVVLAGDIFDLFVGDKPLFLERYRDFLSASRAALERGVQIHYVEGNHDFMLRDAFRGMDGFFVHSQDVSLQLDQTRFFIAHGDLVDHADVAYLLLRQFFRSVAMQTFVRFTPGRVLDLIGKSSSRYSRTANRPDMPTHPRQRSAFHAFACARIREGYDFVILGHSHDADESSLAVDGRKGRYYNLGYPPVDGTYLVWTGAESGFRREPL